MRCGNSSVKNTGPGGSKFVHASPATRPSGPRAFARWPSMEVCRPPSTRGAQTTRPSATLVRPSAAHGAPAGAVVRAGTSSRWAPSHLTASGRPTSTPSTPSPAPAHAPRPRHWSAEGRDRASTRKFDGRSSSLLHDEDLGPRLDLELRALLLPYAVEDAEHLPVDVLGKQLRHRSFVDDSHLGTSA